MPAITARLKALNIELPTPAAAVANYVGYVIDGKTIYISGQLPIHNGEKRFIGKIGDMFSAAEGQQAAKLCAINILAQAKAAADGDLSRVRCVKLSGFVNAVHDFTAHPQVINGASDLMVDVLGDAGRHARSAVGVASLPFGVAVEIEAIFAFTN